jgi:hypothetical protein
MSETITGFALAEVQKTLLGSILQGDRTGSQRWTAELICTEKGYPKLLGIYIFLGYRYFLPAGYSWVSHTRQKIRVMEEKWRASGANIKAFRNSIEVRALVAEWSEIWCQQQQKAVAKLPTKKEVFGAAASLKENLKKTPTPSLHTSVTSIWKTGYDCDDLRILGNELMWAIQHHQMTRALLYFTWMWELDDERVKGSPAVFLLKRGPTHLPDSGREHIGWFLYSLFTAYSNLLGQQKNIVLEALELWKESWLLFGKQQRKQTLGAICTWLTEGTFINSQLIKDPNQIRKIVGENEAIYGIIKNEMDGFIEQKAEEEIRKEATQYVDKFNMTKQQKEKVALKKIDIMNKKLASMMGIDFSDFDDVA